MRWRRSSAASSSPSLIPVGPPKPIGDDPAKVVTGPRSRCPGAVPTRDGSNSHGSSDCSCQLCLELGHHECPKSSPVPSVRPTRSTKLQEPKPSLMGDFILRRALPLLPRGVEGPAPSLEWQEADSDYEGRATLPKLRNRMQDLARQQSQSQPQQQQQQSLSPNQHKTVIYFGDTERRERRDRAGSRVAELQQISSSAMDKSVVEVVPGVDQDGKCREVVARDEGVDDLGSGRCLVISMKPSREDVVRIEQSEGRIEDYWLLPGDNTGFKADWGFVQQWRLRGPNASTRDLYSQSYSDPASVEASNGPHHQKSHQTVQMIAERDTDSLAPTPSPTTRRHPHDSPQHHHLELHDLRRRPECTGNSSSDENRSSGHASMSDTGGHTSSSSPPHPHRPSQQQQLNSVPEDDKLSASVTQRNARNRNNQNRTRHRATPAKLQVPWSGAGLEDIKLAIQQLTMRSHTSTSTYSSLSGSESSANENQQPSNNGNDNVIAGQNSGCGSGVRRLVRHSSLETINTNVTSADEFVWVDSHNRLVELQQLPWTHQDVLKVLQNGRAKEHIEQVTMETVPRLSYLLQRALVRIAREVQRLAKPLGFCSKHEVYSAFRIVLCPALANSCTKACLRAAAMYAVSGDQHRQSKATRSSLQLPVGRFLRWMSDARLGRLVHEYAAVYLAAGIENLLEEILLQCMPGEPGANLTATMLEQAIANSGDLWGLLQPYAHLNAGRLASGALAMPRWESVSSLSSSSSRSNNTGTNSSHNSNNSPTEPQPTGLPGVGHPQDPALLTTCVGSCHELADLINRIGRAGRAPLPLTRKALAALFYYMRCSQLEHGERGSLIQELAYERAYVVLPPLVEWLRVATAHAEHRHDRAVDQDDVAQAARLLLPGVDCPARSICADEIALGARRADDSFDYARKFTLDMAFRLLVSGRPELIAQAVPMLPQPTKINTINDQGFTALMLACVHGDESAVLALLDAGASVDVETPAGGKRKPLPSLTSSSSTSSNGSSNGNSPAKPSPVSSSRSFLCQSPRNVSFGLSASSTSLAGGQSQGNGGTGSLTNSQYTMINGETQFWTALTYTALLGHCNIARILLERGAAVEGGAILSEDRSTVTPLQAAAASGNTEMVGLLLSHGAQPFLSTLIKDPFSYSGSVQRGCYTPISVAAAHGQHSCLHLLITHPRNFSPKRGEKEILSLEEILAEGSTQTTVDNRENRGNELVFSKIQNKALQEAMYHSVESNFLDITMELRRLKVSWTLHCWMQSLSTAHEMRLDSVIDQLLQDFLQVCPEDYSLQFVQDCLPLLFNIFRYSKKEGTTLLLADIFCTCYGWEPTKPVKDTSLCTSGSRIDPKFVNNPELSDVQFRVEGKVFYGHKIVLVTSSPRFRNMLSSKLCEGNPPIVQINDIRYHIFQLVMEYLYNGGCATLTVSSSDVLELMAAANFFQLEGLLRFCESQCSSMVDLDNIVSMYIHAKVYNAVQLLEYCQGFLLQNMVALLTYDDSVKRLIFAKKLPNHDVLAGLLSTLQARLKAKKPQSQMKPLVKA